MTDQEKYSLERNMLAEDNQVGNNMKNTLCYGSFIQNLSCAQLCANKFLNAI